MPTKPLSHSTFGSRTATDSPFYKGSRPQSPKLRDRVEKVVNAFFTNFKGFLIFFGGLEAIHIFTGVFDKTKISSDLFSKMTELKSQTKDLTDLVGIIDIRKAVYFPERVTQLLPLKNLATRQSRQNIHYLVNNIALPVIGSVSFLVKMGLVSDRRERCSLLCRILPVISLCCILPTGFEDLYHKDEKVQSFERLKIIYQMAITTFKCSIKSSSFLFNLISDGVRAKILALDSLYQVTTTAVGAWSSSRSS